MDLNIKGVTLYYNDLSGKKTKVQLFHCLTIEIADRLLICHVFELNNVKDWQKQERSFNLYSQMASIVLLTG